MSDHTVSSAESTDTGLTPNVAGALAYALGIITGVLFLVLEKRNGFVRFHAAQSVVITAAWIALSIGLFIIETILTFIPVLGWIVAAAGFLLGIALFFAGLALWLLLMYRAYQGREWELPVIGAYARRLAGLGVR